MTSVVVFSLVALGGLGLGLYRTAPPLARVVGLLALLAFAAAALDPVAVSFGTSAVPRAAAEVGLDDGQNRVALATAAARAGARAADLAITWRGSSVALPAGSVGARSAYVGAALPLQPEDLQAQLLRPAAVDRPTALVVAAPGLLEPLQARVVVRSGAQEVLRQDVVLAPDQPAELPFTPTAAGVHTLEIEVACGAHRVGRGGTFAVTAAPRVLVLEPSGTLAAALRVQGAAVAVHTQLPNDWREAAALVLGAPLPAAAQAEVVAAVRDGLGLFVLAPAFGGDGEPLRSVLPLRPLPPPSEEAGPGAATQPAPAAPPADAPPEAPPSDAPPPAPPRPPQGDTGQAGPVGKDPVEVDKHTIAMVLVVDRSGSMGEKVVGNRTKMDFAKASALQTSRQLLEGDEVGVVTFGNKGLGQVVLPLTDATNLATVRAGIAQLAHARELTYLLSGLDQADRLLQPSRAAVKHVVVITDGEFDVSEALALQRTARLMRTERQTTLSILSIVGADTDGEFKKHAYAIAEAGGGQFIAETDPTRVPVFVSAEVTRALSRVNRQPRTDGEPGPEPRDETPPQQAPPAEPPAPPAAAPPPAPPVAARVAVRQMAEAAVLQPAPADDWPTLAAVTPSTAPLDAQVLLVAGDQGFALLCYGNRGLGRVGAFAADLAGAAGAEFRAEPAFAARLAQWVQHVLRAEPQRDAASLLVTSTVTPPAPAPRDLAALAALGGEPAVALAEAPAAPPAAPQRLVTSLARRWALPCLGLLLLLAAIERWLAARSFRHG